MAEKDVQKWTTFFHEAGVPRGPAKEYAALFCNHRIKDDLLGDLTKDILTDIGITVMGDIMSILKHAKAVFLKLEREKSSNQLVQDPESVDEPSSKQDPLPAQSLTQMKKKKVVTKLSNKLNTEVQQPKVLMSTTKRKLTAAEPKITVNVDDAPVVAAKKKPATATMTLSERFASEADSQPKVSDVVLKKKKEAQTNTVKELTKTKTLTEKLASTKKVTTAPVKRKSAFERLGKEEESDVSKHMERLSPKIRITKLLKSPVTAPASKMVSLVKNESSVFNRLGESDPSSVASVDRTAALTIRTAKGSRIVSDNSTEKPAKSHSVLPPLKPIRAVQPVKPVSSVKARVSADTTKESNRKSVFSRLGGQT